MSSIALFWQVLVCETPGIWGSLPKGYDHLWLGLLDVYITYDVADTTGFAFKKGELLFCRTESSISSIYLINIYLLFCIHLFFVIESATKLEIHYDKEHEICAMVRL
jgi:hypothetical protein